MMAIQNFQAIVEDREVIVVDIPDVLETRPWGLRWMGKRRHKQFVCWRDKEGEKCYVSPEFLRTVCGNQNIRRLQGDRVWFGIPCLKGGGKGSSSDLEARKEELRKQRLERERQKRKSMG